MLRLSLNKDPLRDIEITLSRAENLGLYEVPSHQTNQTNIAIKFEKIVEVKFKQYIGNLALQPMDIEHIGEGMVVFTEQIYEGAKLSQ